MTELAISEQLVSTVIGQVAPAPAIRAEDGWLVLDGTVPDLGEDGVTMTAGRYRPTEVCDQGIDVPRGTRPGGISEDEAAAGRRAAPPGRRHHRARQRRQRGGAARGRGPPHHPLGDGRRGEEAQGFRRRGLGALRRHANPRAAVHLQPRVSARG